MAQVLDETERYWRAWAGRCTYEGRWRDMIVRSLITLKAMTYAPTGGIVAAPTTSLPEELGGSRNWDYRYCWLRDSSLTLDALIIGGYVDEARAFRDWLLRAVAGDPAQLQIMYDIAGARRLTEFELPWLPGYEGSKPVRVGNAASGQFQLDVYGEALAAIYSGRRMGMAGRHDVWAPAKALIDFITDAWQRPDDGIWEVRGGRRHFTHSKVMAWVAIDRAYKLIDEFGVSDPEGRSLLPHLSAVRAADPRGGVRPRVQPQGGRLHAVVRQRPPGRQRAGHSALRVPARARSADGRHRRGHREGPAARRVRAAVRDRIGRRRPARAARAPSWPAASGWPRTTPTPAASTRPRRCSSGCSGCAIIWASTPRNTTSKLGRQIGNFPQAFTHLAFISTAHVIENIRLGGTTGVAAGQPLH